MSRVEKGSTRLRVGLAAVVGLACCRRSAWSPGRLRRPAAAGSAPEDPASAEKVVLSHDDSAPVPTGPVKERKLRAGRAALDADDGRAVHAVPADREGHRRLPVLPARPGPARGRLADRHPDPARQPRGRAPRHPVPGRGERGRRRPRPRTPPRPSRAGPASAGWASRASSTTSTTPRGWVPGRPVAARPSPARATASRSTATPGSSCRCTTTCCKGDGPTCPSTQIRWTPKAGSDIKARPHHAAAGAGRAAVPLRARARRALRPRGVRRGRQGAVRRGHGPAGQPAAPAVRHQRLRHRRRRRAPADPALDDHPRRRRPHAPARAVDQDRGQPGDARRAPRCSTSRCGTSTTRAPSASSRCTSTPATPCASPATTARSCATCCRRSTARRRSTSSGARAPPTRCASASSRSSFDDEAWDLTSRLLTGSVVSCRARRTAASSRTRPAGRTRRAGPTP